MFEDENPNFLDVEITPSGKKSSERAHSPVITLISLVLCHGIIGFLG